MSGTRTRETKFMSEAEFEEQKQVFKSKKATVEVTVKVKKRRHHDPEVKELGLPDKNFPKGSWGDLLSQNRVGEAKESVKDVNSKIHRKELKCVSEDGDNPKALCHRIPISDDLYLETHTHVKSRSTSVKSKEHERNKKQEMFVAENEFLRTEIERLRQEVENIKLQNRKKKESYRSIKRNAVQSSRIESRAVTQKGSRISVGRESKHTSTTNIIPVVDKRSGVTQTDGRSPGKANASMSLERVGKNDSMEMENTALRNEAAQLLAEMQKAKQEQQESIMTIKELYQMAELLKRENQELVGAQEQQQFLQDKLVQALTENQDLKGYLDTVMKKQKESSHVHDDQLTKIRNVIQEVKSTIADEIQGITSQNKASLYAPPESIRAFDFNISEGGSALLNDTNASEIQRILGSLEESELKGHGETSLDADAVMSHMLTPPLGAETQRVSTPVSIASDVLSVKEDSYQRNEILSDGTKEDPIESLRKDISRSFKPIQMELLNGSSASSYLSSSSTPTNITP